MDKNLGSVKSWEEALRLVKTVCEEEGIDTIATVSLSEYQGGKFWGININEPALGGAELIWQTFPEMAVALYPGNSEFYVVKKPIQFPGQGWKDMLVIVYLKPNEQWAS